MKLISRICSIKEENSKTQVSEILCTFPFTLRYFRSVFRFAPSCEQPIKRRSSCGEDERDKILDTKLLPFKTGRSSWDSCFIPPCFQTQQPGKPPCQVKYYWMYHLLKQAANKLNTSHFNLAYFIDHMSHIWRRSGQFQSITLCFYTKENRTHFKMKEPR